jgi:serine protease AprX
VNRLSKRILIIASASLSMTCGTAFAGTKLHLNVGVIETKSIEAVQGRADNAVTLDTIIQFASAITEADKASLRAIGAEIFGYLPDDALIVRISQANANHWRRGHKNVQAIIPFKAEYKESPFFAPASIFNRDLQQTILIKTFKASEALEIAGKIKNLGKSAVYDVAGTSIVASVPRSVVRSVADIQGVEHVQPYLKMQSMYMALQEGLGPIAASTAGDYTDLNGFETGTKVLNFDAAWAQGFTGRNQVVAMADTGLDGGENNLFVDFKDVVVKGFIFGLFSKGWDDPMGHGTHVAGSVLGRGTASGGKIKGGAYEAKFVPEGMWSPMMKNLTVPSKIQDLFSKAYAEGARIHTNSWGAAANFGAYDNYASNVDDFMFNNPEMLILYAAGNSGVDANKDGRIDPGSISSPGTAKNALTVGASENTVSVGGIQLPVNKLRSAADHWGAEPIFSSYVSDNANGLAMFSSRGPTLDGRLKPEIVAPGTNILSNRSHVPDASTLWGIYNDDYVFSGGTSMATPLAAGGAAVARQILQEKFGLATPSAAIVKATLMHTAVDMFPGQYGEVGAARGQELLTRRPNMDEGYGRLDVSRVSGLTPSTVFVDNKDGVAQGQAQDVTVVLANSGTLLVNLVYTDAPASPDAAVALVNDLDVELTGPDGKVTASHDRVNNNEVIELSNLPAGTYKISVRGVKIPLGKNGKQPYAVVYTARYINKITVLNDIKHGCVPRTWPLYFLYLDRFHLISSVKFAKTFEVTHLSSREVFRWLLLMLVTMQFILVTGSVRSQRLKPKKSSATSRLSIRFKSLILA